MDSTQVHQFVHHRFHIAKLCDTANFVHLHSAALGGEIEYTAQFVGQLAGLRFFIVGIHTDVGFALNFQSRRQCRLHHLPHSAEIVVGNPLPEFELRMHHDRSGVDHRNDAFHLISLGLLVVHDVYDSCVNFFASEWHKHSAANLQIGLHFFRNAVGVGAFYSERDDEFGKLSHKGLR